MATETVSMKVIYILPQINKDHMPPFFDVVIRGKDQFCFKQYMYVLLVSRDA